MIRAALIAGALALAACGMGGAPGDDTTNPDGHPTVDAPTSGDASGCSVDVQFSPDPATAGVGATVMAHAVVIGSFGAESYQWDIRNPVGDSLPLAPDSTAETVTFPIETEGDYQVILDVISGTPCPQYFEPFHVLQPGANSATWRFRITPNESIAAPPQEVVRVVPSSAEIDIGDIILDAGVPISTSVRDATGGIPAYVRITSATALMVEAYSNAATGALVTNIPVGPVEVLVVPGEGANPDLAPLKISAWTGSMITVDTGVAVSGTVRGPAGAALASARVSLRVDGVPSTVATTAGNGTYTLHARPGAQTVITVNPADVTGLPDLTATLGALGSTIDVRYDMTVTTRNLTGTVLERAGVPTPGERITFLGDLGAAGIVTMGTANTTAIGSVSITAVAGAGGALPTTRAPARELTAVLVPDLAEAAVVTVDLTGGVPGSIDAPAMQPMTMRIVGPGAELVPGVKLVAIPIGDLALGAMAPAVGTTAGDGTISLPVAPGGLYDVVIDDPHRHWARRYLLSATAGAYGDQVVERAMRILGTIKKPGGAGAARASGVQVFCYTCSPIEASRPVSESATSATGGFTVTVTDPGVMTIVPASFE